MVKSVVIYLAKKDQHFFKLYSDETYVCYKPAKGPNPNDSLCFLSFNKKIKLREDRIKANKTLSDFMRKK
jgi:hypothetical protein